MDEFYNKMYNAPELVNIKIKKYYSTILSLFNQSANNGKIQLEVKKLKWDLKKKYQELGNYVVQKKEQKSICDFSQDAIYLQKINDIIKLKFYIEERLKEKYYRLDI
tara:strand:+ start:1722 stop:2042 length:321 start_codon:yes stop_codon:yes gene_type:complete